MSAAHWPLDLALERLRGHRLPYCWHETRLNTWQAVCPACRAPEWCLTLTEHGRGGPLTARCSTGCPETTILSALRADPVEVRIGHALGLAEQLSGLAHRALALAGE